MQQLKTYKGIAAFSEVVEERALFFYNEKEQVAQLKGLTHNLIRLMNLINFCLQVLGYKPQSNEVVVGAGICKKNCL